jgi:hypothetical protein
MLFGGLNMSGGHFEYKQYQIREIADSIERELNNQGKLKSKEDLWNDEVYYKKYPEEKQYSIYPKEVQEKFKEALKALRIAEIYAHRVDWFLSGDDGEDVFIQRLSEELAKIE